MRHRSGPPLRAALSRLPRAAVLVVVLLGGCEPEEVLKPLPQLQMELPWDNTAPSPTSATAPANTTAPTSMAVPTTTTVPPPASGPPAARSELTGFLGQNLRELHTGIGQLQDRVAQRKQQLQQINQAAEQDVIRFNATAGGIRSRLQPPGTDPSNPQLVGQSNEAKASLDRLSGAVARLNGLADALTGDRAMAVYLADTARAAGNLQKAGGETHSDLPKMQGEIAAVTQDIDHLLGATGEATSRLGTTIEVERTDLDALAAAIKTGTLSGSGNAAKNPAAPAAAAGMPATAPPQALPPVAAASSSAQGSAGLGDRKPLVVIRFDRPDVAYEQALYTAVRAALERKPSANFDLVAISPQGGTPAQLQERTRTAKQNADAVMHSLARMGLPADRVTVAATMSPTVETSEIHLYVR